MLLLLLLFLLEKSTGNKNIKSVGADELTIIDNVTHYNGTPFTGSMYYNFGQIKALTKSYL